MADDLEAVRRGGHVPIAEKPTEVAKASAASSPSASGP